MAEQLTKEKVLPYFPSSKYQLGSWQMNKFNNLSLGMYCFGYPWLDVRIYLGYYFFRFNINLHYDSFAMRKDRKEYYNRYL